MEKLKSEMVMMIRSCLISNKGEMTLRQLDNDYRTLCGERIAYGKLGFKTLEDFINSVDTVSLVFNGKETVVKARTSEKSQHIQLMVNKQKSSSRKPALPKMVRFNYRTSQNQSTTLTNRWRPKDVTNRSKSNFPNSPRPAAVSHNQFVNARSFKTKQPRSPISSTKVDLSERLQTKMHIQEMNNVPQTPTPTLSPSPPKDTTPCTSLSSTKKRLTKIMTGLKPERDSGNSSPTSDIAPRIEDNIDFTRTDNPLQDLKMFAELHKLGDIEISSKEVKTKKIRERFFTAKITVGKHSFNSYPEEFRDAREAEKCCAKKALDELVPKFSRRKSLLLASESDILERIPPMLEKHNHGIWAWQLELDYEDTYNEQLPTDWLKIIDSSSCIQVEKCSTNYVLRHCEPGDKGQKWNTMMMISDVSVPSNTVQIGDDAKLTGQITCVMSANEIWCRQCDTPDFEAYTNMMIDLEQYYNTHRESLRVSVPTLGRYYVAYVDGEWFRVRTVTLVGDQISCFYIDFGQECLVVKENLYQMKRQFAICQAQAFVCRLVGLEDLYEASLNSEKLESIMGKQVIIEASPDDSKNVLAVYMYHIDTGKCLNEELIPVLSMESALPVLQQDTVNEVYVTHIESNGDVYVQLHSRGYESLQELLLNLEKQIMTTPPTNILEPLTKELSKGRIYFAKYKLDSHWYRVSIIDWAPQGNFAQIYFLDYGNTDVININSDILFPMDKLSDVINQFPAQAVKVKMDLDIIPTDFVELATNLMPNDQEVLLKILKHDEEEVPVVELFKRAPDAGLFCVNKSILMQSELKKSDGNNNSNKSMKRKLIAFGDGVTKNVPSGGTLQRPPLPSKDEYLEVHVSFAVNPWNFFVQPLQSRPELYKMMELLQERYKNVQYSPLQTEDIVPGHIYASKHEDGCWYRTSVMKVIHKGSVSVFYCDFGYYANLTVQQLIPLDPEFMELPYQALKAKLYNIKPKQNKWSVEDCEFFKSLVDKKHLYSVLKDIEKDELYDSDFVLNLILVDTSGPNDVIIGNELISKSIAVEC